MKKIHLIAIGGAIMHNLAIALKRKGYEVTGSDDIIFDPAKRNLKNEDLLPNEGWNTKNIHSGLDQIILGMHAKPDNPELLKAQELGIPIASFPEFVAKISQDKKRLVVAGSHGKTTTTAMIMHVLRKCNVDFDYLVGSSIAGFDLSVRLSEAPLIVIEGDEYLSSPIDRRPKFLWYHPDISIITGIAYDHINVFPTYDSYLSAFSDYIATHKAEDEIIWFEGDKEIEKLMGEAICTSTPYRTPDYEVNKGTCYIQHEGQLIPMEIIGEHNLQNMESARIACNRLGIKDLQFLEAMSDFSGAGRRMEKIYDRNDQVVYRDFAHSPSKLKATINAVRSTHTGRPLLAVFELHTFSSLNEEFLPYYEDSMKEATTAVVYMDPEVFHHKKKEPLSSSFIKSCFGDVEVITSKSNLIELVDRHFYEGYHLLLMSSGTFSGAKFEFS